MHETPRVRTKMQVEDADVIEQFLSAPGESSFAGLFDLLVPQLTSYFRARGCDCALAEDLTQDVMLVVYRNAYQLRVRKLFRAWLYKVARHAMCRHYAGRAKNGREVSLEETGDQWPASGRSAEIPGIEFRQWMNLLDAREREVMTLRFVEEWEYHEIAAAQAIPIGTVQWRVFNAKRKLTPFLSNRLGSEQKRPPVPLATSLG